MSRNFLPPLDLTRQGKEHYPNLTNSIYENTPLQNEAMFLKNKADLLVTQGKHQEAIKKYTASINYYMGDIEAWICRANTYQLLGMIAESLSDQKTAEALREGKFNVCKQSGEVTFNNPKVCKDNT